MTFGWEPNPYYDNEYQRGRFHSNMDGSINGKLPLTDNYNVHIYDKMNIGQVDFVII